MLRRYVVPEGQRMSADKTSELVLGPDQVESELSSGEIVLELQEVRKVYKVGALEVEALRGISLSVDVGSFVAIMGPSGSGKSTLMHILGCLDAPTSGSYHLSGLDISDATETELSEIRNRRIGFVFQAFNLLPMLNAWRNVELPLIYGGVGKHLRKEKAYAALEQVGLTDRADHRPSQLSGGQQQRIAIARAIVTDPAIILADEPTGNLDSSAAADVLSLFKEMHQSGRTVVLITHEREVADTSSRIVHVRDGRVHLVEELGP